MIKKDLVSLLEKMKLPVSVPEILNEVQANKTTIYRELDNFIKEGLVSEVEFGDGKKRYELANKKHHHHVVCKNCGRVADIEIDEKELLSSLNQTDFKIENHSLEFFGLCGSCK